MCFLYKISENSLLSLVDFQAFGKSTALFFNIMRVLGRKRKGDVDPLEQLTMDTD